MDCLTGDVKVVRADILMDIGASINPAIDIGQIEGAFVQARWGPHCDCILLCCLCFLKYVVLLRHVKYRIRGIRPCQMGPTLLLLRTRTAVLFVLLVFVGGRYDSRMTVSMLW